MAAQLELEQKPFIELQIEALIEENCIKQSRVNKFIDELESRILSIKKLNYEKLLNKAFRLPMLGRPNAMDQDYPKNFKFLPPGGLEIVGSFRTCTALRKTNHVDLAVKMPATCITAKDIKNQRYHMKRALYLAQLAHLLGGSTGLELVENLEFSYYQGDFLKPVLIITPTKDKLKRTTFQLFVIPHQDAPLKLSMLTPDHGNIAPKWFFKDYPLEDVKDSEIQTFVNGDSDVTESPFYNSSITHDIELVSNSDVIYEQIGNHTSITHALVLTKVWLFQRRLHHYFSFILSMFVAYLQTKQLIHRNMSKYQIFKKIIQSLVSTDWVNPGLSFYDDSQEKISKFKKLFPVVFLSPSGQMNLCYNISIDLYQRLKHEAKLAEAILSKNHSKTFDLLFLEKIEFINKFDVIVQIPKCTKKLPVKMEYMKKFLDHGVFIPRVYSESILNIVQTGLTDRVTLIQQSSDHLLMDRKWNIKSVAYNPSYEDATFTLGLLLEPEKSLRIIDIGPEAQSPEAEKFREFWGPKCHLRLQNGVISETVVWHVDRFSQRREIIKFILNHCMKKAEINNIVIHHTSLEKFISIDNAYFRWNEERESVTETVEGKRKREEKPKGKAIGIGEEMYQKLLNAYNSFNKSIRNEADILPHLIISVQPMSSHLRSCSVFPPLPAGLQVMQKTLKRHKGVTLFPKQFKEVGKILHIEPVELLITLGGNIPAKFDPDASKADFFLKLSDSLPYPKKMGNSYLDVLYSQFVFRLRVKGPKDRPDKSEISPLVHANLDQLFREKPAFGITCRLVKRWLTCQLMTDLLDSITIETMVADLFQSPEPYTEPASSLCGFRRFLVLNAAKTDSKEDNIRMLNKLCAKALSGESEYVDLFKPDFKMFDIRIKLSPNVIQNNFLRIDHPSQFKILGKETTLKVMPIVDLNLVEQFVKKLRVKFDRVAQFYYDKFGQQMIGVILRPDSEKFLDGDLKGFLRDIKAESGDIIDKIKVVIRA